jgi:hypothetical protein
MGRSKARRLSIEAVVFAFVLTGCVTTGSNSANPICAINYPPQLTAEELKLVPRKLKVWTAGVKNALIANKCAR